MVLLAVACVLGLGWWKRDAARDLLAPVVPARLAPLLAPLLDKPGAPASAAGEDAAKDTQKDAPADPNVVTLDAAGQKRLGLAFGPVETRRIVLPVRTPGTVAFDERRVTHLKPRAAGRVLSLAVQPGDAVRAGQTLATLDAAGLLEARNGLAEAQASLAEAQATEAVAALNLTRGQDLMKVSGVAQAEVDRRRVDLAKAQAATASAR
ncbi:RND transporter, partial [Methylobacterium indicum]